MGNILVIGGAGFVGSHLVPRLSSQGHEVSVYDCFRSPSVADPAVQKLANHRWSSVREVARRCISDDVRNRERLHAAIATCDPEVVIYLPALLAKESDQAWEEALSIQVDGLRNTLDALKYREIPCRLIYASSSFVYGHFRTIPAPEDHWTAPVDTYGRSKLIGEELVRAYASKSVIDFTIVRPAGIYGFGDSHVYVERTATSMLYSAALRIPFTVPSASSVIDFTYVEDAVQGICRCAFSAAARNATFNVTYGEGRTFTEFAAIVRQLVPDFEVTLLDPPRSPQSNAPLRGALDVRKAKALIDYRPQFAIEKGIEQTLIEYERYLRQ